MAVAIGVFGCAIAVLCTPPLVRRCFALGPLYEDDVPPLWGFAALLFALSVVAFLAGQRGRVRLAALHGSLLLLICVELGARLAIIAAAPGLRGELAWAEAQTHADLAALQGHAFLQFVGRPRQALHGNRAHGDLTPYNNLGFLGRDFEIAKPADVVRVACLGGSTTASGYPAVTERVLSELLERQGHRAETMNFAHPFYTSAHSLVNFVLNVLDYDVDYVVIHDGWNDLRVRNAAPGTFRSDYGHAFKSFEFPSRPDWLLIRASALYRWAKLRLDPTLAEVSLDAAVVRRRSYVGGCGQAELAPFRRNLRTIIDLALLRGITPVLMTQPHSTDPAILYHENSAHIALCSGIVREIAAEYGDAVVLIDLDCAVTGVRNDVFVDVGHMTEPGIALAGQMAADAIFAHWIASGVARATEASARTR